MANPPFFSEPLHVQPLRRTYVGEVRRLTASQLDGGILENR